jgi:single-stranded-DNA-specific exonuclease
MKYRIQRRSPEQADVFPDTLHPVLRRILAGRAVTSTADVDYSLANLHPYTALGGTQEAARLLADLMAADGQILIISDYDVDGATSTALAVRALKAMGAGDVDFLVPDRFVHGYGLSPDVAELAMERQPGLVVTVDNGISSLDGVALLRAQGIDVLITDHHLPGERLPDANVIVNPNQPGDAFPSRNLAGVGVMFYVLAALRAELRERDWFAQRGLTEPNLAAYLDLVALGTVADVVPLDYNNRILVSHGLALIRSGRCVAGIDALLRVAKRTRGNLNAADLGFAVAPRLNAAGRLTDMRLGIDCLICDDPDRALAMARQLDELNRERRDIQDTMHEQALAAIERLNLSQQEDLPSGLCLYQKDWHQGVVGIVASRIKDKLQRPVIAFAPEEGDLLKGSARSIPGLHIKDVLDRITTLQPGLIRKYGGHAMAAGLTLEKRHYETFSKLYDEQVRQHVAVYGFADTLLTDGELQAGDFTLGLAEILQKAGPWGQGFPEPVFDGEFTVLASRVVGERHLKLELAVAGDDRRINAIAFNQADTPGIRIGRGVHAAYRLDINEYRGIRSLQLVVETLSTAATSN